MNVNTGWHCEHAQCALLLYRKPSASNVGAYLDTEFFELIIVYGESVSGRRVQKTSLQWNCGLTSRYRQRTYNKRKNLVGSFLEQVYELCLLNWSKSLIDRNQRIIFACCTVTLIILINMSRTPYSLEFSCALPPMENIFSSIFNRAVWCNRFC